MAYILIVDDLEENIYMLEALLRGYGYQAESARNGIEALDIARRQTPDLLITDILMPGMDGFSLCREWMADEVLKHVPLVFYTATYTDPKDEAFALSLGAARFVIKPTEPDVFVEILRQVLENHAAQRLTPLVSSDQSAEAYYQQYSQALIRKLESKMMQLEEANRALELDIAERIRTEESLRRIEWMLTPGHAAAGDGAAPSYGDLTDLNTERTILDAVGPRLLDDIVFDYLDLLDTSAAVYERNGDYALGIFSSGWCRYLDGASRQLCGTDDNAEALACGRWHCHESCWTEASKAAIERGEPTDIECAGGLRLYAVPIRAGDRIIGAINFGYGDPPRDPQVLRDLATKYAVAVDELARHATAYESRPPYIVDLAKRRIESSARLIGEIVVGKQHKAYIEHLNRVLRAIRDVNQLITQEQDRDALLRRACEILISTRGYRSAWAALRGADGKVQTAAESGIGEDFAPIRQALARGDWPACCRQAQERPDGIAPIHDTDRNCTTCCLAYTHRDTAALAGALRHGGRDYGMLVVALPRGLADDLEEQSLFRELVGDVAYALYAMELAQEREEAEEALRASEERFRVAQELSPDGFTLLHPVRNEKGGIVDFTWLYENQTIARINGTDPQKVIGKRLLELFPSHRGTPVFETYLHVANTGKTRILEEVYVGEIVSVPTWLRLVVVSMGEDIAILAHNITARKQAEEKIQEQLDELRRWYAATLGREGRVIELKREVNDLLAQVGQLPRYPSVVEEQ